MGKHSKWSMSTIDKLNYLRREMLAIRHDWAMAMNEQGRDTVTKEIDVALAGMEVEIQYIIAKGNQP